MDEIISLNRKIPHKCEFDNSRSNNRYIVLECTKCGTKLIKRYDHTDTENGYVSKLQKMWVKLFDKKTLSVKEFYNLLENNFTINEIANTID